MEGWRTSLWLRSLSGCQTYWWKTRRCSVLVCLFVSLPVCRATRLLVSLFVCLHYSMNHICVKSSVHSFAVLSICLSSLSAIQRIGKFIPPTLKSLSYQRSIALSSLESDSQNIALHDVLTDGKFALFVSAF